MPAFVLMWENQAMRKFEQPMMILCVAYAIMMAVLGWRTAVLLGGNITAVMICTIASIFLIVALASWWKRKLMWVAAGEIGCAILFPTAYGMTPMIVGFVIFIVTVGLRIFEMIDGDDV
ncbi:MAG: hypothetical protein PT944_02755 [Actinomycetaceae bacterium]|nr:hypothetical protein [Actinomycetaceae bacterium]